MLERIVTGVIIGFVCGFFLFKDGGKSDLKRFVLIFMAITSIPFIGTSFMYGAEYGLMAIGEIVVGFVIASSMYKN